MKPRVAAAKAIAEVLSNKSSLNSLLPLYTGKVALKDQGLCKELCFGTLRWYPRIALILEHLLAKPFKKKDLDLQALLASAIYQLEFTRIPPHAAINETVASTKLLNKAWAKGLINAVLRNYQRSNEDIAALFANNESYRTAHPAWLTDLWQASWPEQFEQIIGANNERPPMSLRVNSALTTRDDYLQKLQTANIAAAPTAFSQSGLTLEQSVDVTALPGFSDGLVSVQDEAAQLAGEILQPQQGERILDACCAPGGKLGHLIEQLNYCGTAHAIEVDGHRMERVEENIARLTQLKKDTSAQLKLQLITADASSPEQWWDGLPYQKILLDAPCSATGVIRRNPDIKLLRSSADIEKLATLQRQLLDSLWPLLEEGGSLLYATCSSLPAENDAVIEDFVAKTTNVQIEPIVGCWGVATAYGRQLFPQIDGHDGFYYALLKKIVIT